MRCCCCCGARPLATVLLLLVLLPFALALPDLSKLAVNDPGHDFFGDVAEKEWQAWEMDLSENASISELVSSVQSAWPASIHVRLVGWNAASAAQLRSARLPPLRTLAKFLGHHHHHHELASDEVAHASVPLHLSVSTAPTALLSALEAARDELVHASDLRHAEISPERLEALLEADRKAQQGAERGWFLYLLNLTSVPDQSYGYICSEDAPCASPLMVHASSRLGWLDQAAAAADWGAVVAGLGHADARHVPHGPQPALADVLAFVHRTAAQLLAPSQYLLPRYVAEPAPLQVRVVVLRSAPQLSEPAPALAEAVTSALGGIAFDARGVRVESRVAALADWAPGAAALASAVRTRTSAYHSDAQLRVTVHPYIDTQLLAEALTPLLPSFDVARGSARVVRVVLFDLGGAEPLLLDRLHQAVAVSADLVLAVQTNAPRVSLDHRCGRRSLVMDARNATRAVLSALLTAVYGLAPTHEALHSGAADEEALEWAAGRSLAGAFSSYSAVTRTHADAARRAYVMQTVHSAEAQLRRLAAQPELDVPPSELMSARVARAFRRRVLLLRFLWLSAAQAQNDYQQVPALELARAAALEARRVERLALSAAATRRAQLSCPRPVVFAVDRVTLLFSLILLSMGSTVVVVLRNRHRLATLAS